MDYGTYSRKQPFSFTSVDLANGEYFFSIVDFAIKPVCSPFLHLDLNISAVPEPQTYAMMLAGLAALGVTFRRRAVA